MRDILDKLNQLNEQSYLEKYQEPFDIQTSLDHIEEEQEYLDSLGISYSEEGNTKKALICDREYKAHEAIKNVLINYQKVQANASLKNGTLFLWIVGSDSIVDAALFAYQDSPDSMEIKWLGSVIGGGGSELLEAAQRYAREHNIKRLHLTAKWESDGFYLNRGFEKFADPDPLSSALGAGASYRKTIESKEANLPDLEIGDELLIGKFKNRTARIKGFTTDQNNQPVAQTDKGDQKLFKPRIKKLMPKD